jgi:hypothetical protein
MLKRALISLKYFRPLLVKLLKKKNYIKWSSFLLSFNSYCYLNCQRKLFLFNLIVKTIKKKVPFFSQRLRLKVPFSEVAPCPFEILARTLWLMGILNLVYCYLFLFVYLAVLQAIYIDMVFCRVNVSPLFLFPLNPGISWKWTENSLFWLEYLSVLCDGNFTADLHKL